MYDGRRPARSLGCPLGRLDARVDVDDRITDPEWMSDIGLTEDPDIRARVFR